MVKKGEGCFDRELLSGDQWPIIVCQPPAFYSVSVG